MIWPPRPASGSLPPSVVELEKAPLERVTELLGDPRPGYRADAACAVGDRLRTGELDALSEPLRTTLVGLLDDAEIFVRFEAAVALAEAGERRATPILLAALRQRAVRLDAIRALGRLGDPAAVPSLRQLFERWLLPWADRLQTAAALCALGDRDGAALLSARLTSRRPAERAAAIHFLAESRHPQARTLLEKILADPHHPQRDAAARALGALGDPAARPALETARAGASGDAELGVDLDEALQRLDRPT